jgi:hypothetical protein
MDSGTAAVHTAMLSTDIAEGIEVKGGDSGTAGNWNVMPWGEGGNKQNDAVGRVSGASK